MKFKLVQKSVGKSLTVFNVLDDKGGVIGSVNVPNKEASNLLHAGTFAIAPGPGVFAGGTYPPFSHGRQTTVVGERSACCRSSRFLNVDCKTGLSAAINLAAACENDLGMVVLGIGASPEPGANPTLDFRMEIAGKHLLFRIGLYGDEIRFAASVMDNVTPPETLLRTRDDTAGWQLVTRLAGALERAEIKSLEPPIEAGTPGDPDCFVIG